MFENEVFENEVFMPGDEMRELNGEARFKPLRIRRERGLAVRDGLATGERND